MWALPVLREPKNRWDKCTEKNNLQHDTTSVITRQVHSVYRKEKSKGSRPPWETEIEEKETAMQSAWEGVLKSWNSTIVGPRENTRSLLMDAVWSLKQDWRHFTPAFPLSGTLQMLSISSFLQSPCALVMFAMEPRDLTLITALTLCNKWSSGSTNYKERSQWQLLG